MNELKIVLLTGLLTISSSIITALITLKVTHRNEVKKHIWEKRAELYFEFYDEAEKLFYDRYRIYDKNFIKVLLKFKPKIKLLASDKTMDAFKSFYEFICKNYEEYRDFYIENDPREKPEFQETDFDDDGVPYIICHATGMDISDFESFLEEYKKKNVPNFETINKYINNMYKDMRNDLGSNIK